MQPGTVIYVRKECQNWKQYQVKAMVLRHKTEYKNLLGISYLAQMAGSGGRYVTLWASDYFAGQKERAVKKTPWKGIPIFDTLEDEDVFKLNNLLERS